LLCDTSSIVKALIRRLPCPVPAHIGRNSLPWLVMRCGARCCHVHCETAGGNGPNPLGPRLSVQRTRTARSAGGDVPIDWVSPSPRSGVHVGIPALRDRMPPALPLAKGDGARCLFGASPRAFAYPESPVSPMHRQAWGTEHVRGAKPGCAVPCTRDCSQVPNRPRRRRAMLTSHVPQRFRSLGTCAPPQGADGYQVTGCRSSLPQGMSCPTCAPRPVMRGPTCAVVWCAPVACPV